MELNPHFQQALQLETVYDSATCHARVRCVAACSVVRHPVCQLRLD